MFQKIIETTNLNEQIIHTLEAGTVVSGIELDLIDLETLGEGRAEGTLHSIIKDIPEGNILKIYFKSKYSNKNSKNHSRHQAISEIGSISNQCVLLFEKYPQIDLKFLKAKKFNMTPFEGLNSVQSLSLNYHYLEKSEIEDYFPKMKNEIFHQFQTIDLGNEVLSILRLEKTSEFGVSLKTLSEIKDQIPLPYTICCAIEPVSDSRAELLLQRRSKQNSGNDLKESRKLSEAQADLEAITLDGTRLFRFEWQILMTRKNESDLRSDRELIQKILSPLGEIKIESVGALNSLKSFYPGRYPHYTLLEKDSALVTYLPLLTSGESTKIRPVKHSLILHRKDESLTDLNIFNKNYDSFSWCIFGRPGTGKSVLTNAITRALLNDPNIKVIKIDVGGSHSRETEMLGGTEKTLSLNEPTGINPFDVLKVLGPTKESLQILSSFLEVLILEEGETKLSKTMKSDLEQSLQKYAEIGKNYSLEDYFQKIQEIPRKNLLSRWVGTGVYGNAFACGKETQGQRPGVGLQSSNFSSSGLQSPRLFYFNFSKISQALDPDYAQGGLAAVMAQFNLEMLKKSQDKKRIVFIADETPFFIKKCFNFFNLSIANVRKEGHGFITIAQKTQNVVVDGDTGILDNSPSKIYFSTDSDDETFLKRTNLSISGLEKIKQLEQKQGEFSECLMSDKFGEKVLKMRLSPEEYWSYTSKDEDKQKYAELKKACPHLKTEEIIKCLSL